MNEASGYIPGYGWIQSAGWAKSFYGPDPADGAYVAHAWVKTSRSKKRQAMGGFCHPGFGRTIRGDSSTLMCTPRMLHYPKINYHLFYNDQ